MVGSAFRRELACNYSVATVLNENRCTNVTVWTDNDAALNAIIFRDKELPYLAI